MSTASYPDAADAIMTHKDKTDSDYLLIYKSLTKHFIFKNLSKEQQDTIMSAMKYYCLPADSNVIEQGKPGNNFFVIASGKLEVLQNGSKINTLNAGDSFGEMALLQDKPRSATVRTKSICNLWGVDRSTFRKAVQSINEANYEQNKQFLENVEIFKRLTSRQREALLSSVAVVNYSDGQVIVKEGDTGDLLFLIKEGKVSCTQGGEFRRNMTVGEYFGELALLYRKPRSATVVALVDTKCLVLGGDDLTQALGSQFSQIIYRNSIRMSFEKSRFFSKFTESQVKSLISAVNVQTFEAGSLVVSSGAAKKDMVFIVLNGKLVGNNGQVRAELFEIIDEEGFFKESEELLEDLHTDERADIATISKADLRSIVGTNLDQITYESEVYQILKKVAILRGLSEEKIKRLVTLLKVQNFEAGQTIFMQNSPGDAFFIVKSGKVEVIKDEKVLRQINKFDYFGERSILFSELRTATVRAQGKVECWVLLKSDFFEVIDERIRLRLKQRIEMQDDNITLNDLVIIKKLGSGMFGNVFLSAHKSKRNLYALKAIDRKKIDNEKVIDSLILERKILMQIDHFMILKLIKTFKDSKRLYFLMEHVRGQDLFDVIRELNLLTNKDSKFYIACLVIIFEHLHERDIVYRDLKPENVMVDEEGFPKLIDFGTAKIVQGRTYTMIGTPHYMAPEVILGKGYGIHADYWSLGIMLFEFICGGVPFGENDSDSYAIYEKVLEGRICYPNFAKPSLEAKHFIEQLLSKNPAARNGGSFENLKGHNWFKNFDWESIMDKSYEAPYVPIIPNLNLEIDKAFRAMKNINQVISNEEKYENSQTNFRPRSVNWDYEF
jgi:cGMP-dependent protein kinase